MSNLTDSQRSQLWKKLENKAYRDAFVSSHISTNMAAQIYAIREAHGWTQKELADAAGMAQARISVMEAPSYDRFSLRTLKRLASAFDVALVVRFVPFGELLDWVTNLNPSRISVQSFSQERGLYDISNNTAGSSSMWYGDNVVEWPSGVAATEPAGTSPPVSSDAHKPGSDAKTPAPIIVDNMRQAS